MLEELKKKVFEANMELPRRGLVTYTWGNVSGIDREKGLFVIKPSGVEYDELRPEDLVVMDLNGNKVEGELNPSSDTKTHLVLYNAFPQLGGIVHTHSPYAVGWAQAGEDIPCFGTTHADYFYNDIPCTRDMKKKEVFGEYEKETGNVIVERFSALKPMDTPAVLVKNHGPFTWGTDADNAVHNAVVLEEVAKMAFIAKSIHLSSNIYMGPLESNKPSMNMHLVEKHYSRKHGPNAYYGQKKKKEPRIKKRKNTE